MLCPCGLCVFCVFCRRPLQHPHPSIPHPPPPRAKVRTPLPSPYSTTLPRVGTVHRREHASSGYSPIPIYRLSFIVYRSGQYPYITSRAGETTPLLFSTTYPYSSIILWYFGLCIFSVILVGSPRAPAPFLSTTIQRYQSTMIHIYIQHLLLARMY